MGTVSCWPCVYFTDVLNIFTCWPDGGLTQNIRQFSRGSILGPLYTVGSTS